MVVVVNYNVEVDGEDFTDEELNQCLKILGELVINEVKKKIRQMNLIQEGGGAFLQGWFTSVKNGELSIENVKDYAIYLEYGTYAYHDLYGFESFPETPDPKKKNLSSKDRKLFPKGMQPFSPVRRVLYNTSLMKSLIQDAFS